jgi:hypothetical protein
MDMDALAESLPPPPPPRPREEVEERRFACGGGDADGQGSERQETSEPIALVDLEKGKKKILAFAAQLWRRPRRGRKRGRRRQAGGSGRGSNGRILDTKNLYLFWYRRFCT